MTTGTLHGKTVAILVTDGFEQSELMEPRKRSMKLARRPKLCLRQVRRSKDGITKNGATKSRWTSLSSLQMPANSMPSCCRAGS
jgi:hypothetical protein